jgi:hypothetical protein
LDLAANAPNIVGLVGRLDPADPGFWKNLERFHKNRLFLGIRQGQLHLGLDKPEYMAHLKTLLDAVNAEDRRGVETVFRGVQAPLAKPGQLSRLERPNYDFARYLAQRGSALLGIGGVR